MNAVTHLEQTTTLPTSPAELIFNDHAFQRLERVAQIMASGKATIPAHLRGSVGDCFAILMQAARWRMDPYAVAQKTYFVNSAIGYEAQLVAAVINNNAPIVGRLNYEPFGPWEKVIGKSEVKTNKEGKTYRVPGWKPEDEAGCGVRVWATIRGETEPREINLLLSQALTRNSTLWAEDPVQQLCYLAAKRWARRHCPDVIMGVYTPDELDQPAERDITPAQETQQATTIKDRLRQRIAKPAAVSVLERINSAQSMEELDAVKADAAGLPEQERTVARKRFAERKAELRNAVDTTTGEIIEPAAPGDAGADEYADWIAAIGEKTNVADLAELIRTMPKKTRTALSDEINRRDSEIRQSN